MYIIIIISIKFSPPTLAGWLHWSFQRCTWTSNWSSAMVWTGKSVCVCCMCVWGGCALYVCVRVCVSACVCVHACVQVGGVGWGGRGEEYHILIQPTNSSYIIQDVTLVCLILGGHPVGDCISIDKQRVPVVGAGQQSAPDHGYNAARRHNAALLKTTGHQLSSAVDRERG